jgi:hypothetical protein
VIVGSSGAEPHPQLSRRSFLGGAAGVAAGLGAGAAGGGAMLGAIGATGAAADDGADGAPEPAYVRFLGPHQHGIVSHAPAAGLMAAFNLQAADHGELRDTFRAITDRRRVPR